MSDRKNNIKWSIDEEEELVRLVERSWDWISPSWAQIVMGLNNNFNNNRSVKSCQSKYRRILNSKPKMFD